MKPPEVSGDVIGGDEALQRIANDLRDISEQFASVEVSAVVRGNRSFRGLSWRCQAMANANLLRGQEILRFAVLAVNEGAIIVAHIMARALDETLAAVVFARRKLERAIESRDPEKLGDVLDRLTVGSRYLANRDAVHPSSYSVLSMVDEMGAYLAEVVPETKREVSVFREDYEFVSEFVHPSEGSLTIYQRTSGEKTEFDREVAKGGVAIPYLLEALRMSGHFLLKEAESLANMGDLPADWPIGGWRDRGGA